jgi:hypothetical protein
MALASGLFRKPLLTAIAWTVVVALTGMAPAYGVEDVVGVLPSVV